MVFELSAANAIDYLVDRGILPASGRDAATAQFLGGGVSNIVIRVNPGDEGAAPLVLKQSLPKLRVEEDWFADQERIHRERSGIDYARGLSSNTADASAPGWTVPAVVDEDPDSFVYVMTATPAGAANWKDALLAGHVDVQVAGQVGAMLGTIHLASRVDSGEPPHELRGFADLHSFVQLRIDPYHRATAQAHPDLADIIESEARRMLPSALHQRALVHGDFSPKNIMVDGQRDAARVYLLDFEVVHLGNPVFDLAFMLNHLTLKAIYRSELAERYNDAASAFWSAYLGAFDNPSFDGAAFDSAVLERDTVRQMGVLLLARIDGKSPAEYITQRTKKAQARQLARNILTDNITTLAQLHRDLADNPLP